MPVVTQAKPAILNHHRPSLALLLVLFTNFVRFPKERITCLEVVTANPCQKLHAYYNRCTVVLPCCIPNISGRIYLENFEESEMLKLRFWASNPSLLIFILVDPLLGLMAHGFHPLD